MMGDVFQILGMIIKFRTAIDNPANRVFKRQEFIRDSKYIAIRYFKSSFIIDFIASLPLIQVYIWCKLQSLRSSSTPLTFNFLRDIICIFFIQFWSRFYLLFPYKKKLAETCDIIMRPAWAGALYYLLFYVMLSQFVGAVYYLIFLCLLLRCELRLEKLENKAILGWGEMLRKCEMDDHIENGMLSDLYISQIGSKSFLQRFMYCFSWGLKCLSSMGQNFESSASVVEASISFTMTIFGLVLFAGLIAQMQTCIQSMEPGEEQQMFRQKEVEDWAKKHQLPSELKKHLLYTVESDLRVLRGLDDNTMLSLLPTDLKCGIRRHLYFNRACNLSFFANLDHELAHAFVGHLKIFSCSKETYVAVEGEVIKMILFFLSGKLEISSVTGGSSKSTLLGVGDLCGSELLAWASLPYASIQNLPCSSQSVKCLTDVEAFSLCAEDLKLLGIQFNNCWNFQQALKWHS